MWKYTDEWSPFFAHSTQQARLYDVKSQLHFKLIFGGIIAAGIVFALAYGISSGDWLSATVVPAVVCVLMLPLFYFQRQFESKMLTETLAEQDKDHNTAPVVTIGFRGFTVDGDKTYWWTQGLESLDEVQLIREPGPGIEFTVSRWNGDHYSPIKFLLPIPNGKHLEASQLVVRLKDASDI